MEMFFGETMNSIRYAQDADQAEWLAQQDALIAQGWIRFSVAVTILGGFKDTLDILAKDFAAAEIEAKANSFVTEILSISKSNGVD